MEQVEQLIMNWPWLLTAAGIWAGAQNAVAGGGSFMTLPALMTAGVDARIANITSTVALFPGQVTTALGNRKYISGIGALSFAGLLIIAVIGGVLGALLLLATPSAVFRQFLPWLVLSATALFAWGAFGPKMQSIEGMPRWKLAMGQTAISIYGGYFGGGIGFLMLALFTLAGATVRVAQSNKNWMAAAMNLSSTVVFAFSGEVAWLLAAALSLGAVIGGWIGAKLIARVPEKMLKLLVIGIGLTLTAALFIRG